MDNVDRTIKIFTEKHSVSFCQVYSLCKHTDKSRVSFYPAC